MDYTDLIALVLGNAAKSSQDQNNINDRNTTSLAGDAINRDRFAVAAPGNRLNSSVKASVLSNLKPRTTQWAGRGSGQQGILPKISGGMTDALTNLDPRTKQQANLTMTDQLLGQLRGGASGGGADFKMPVVGQTSLADKLLGGGATAASLLAGAKNGAGSQIPLQGLIDWLKGRGKSDSANITPAPGVENGYGAQDGYGVPENDPTADRTGKGFGAQDGYGVPEAPAAAGTGTDSSLADYLAQLQAGTPLNAEDWDPAAGGRLDGPWGHY